jgi:uncharacterized protein (TIGR04255 family)
VPIPTRLQRPPLIEAIFELRFGPANVGSAELLPGLLYSRLQPWFSEVTNTGLGGVPAELRRQHPELMYAAQTHLKGAGRVLQLGPQVVSLNVTSYPGWNQFRKDCTLLAEAVMSTNVLGAPERLSLKYANVIHHRQDEPLSALKISVNTPGQKISPRGFRLRFETVIGHTLSIVECASGAETKAEPRRKGLLLSIDTILQAEPDLFWERLPTRLDESHSVLESLFFGLLSDESLGSFEPVWEQ